MRLAVHDPFPGSGCPSGDPAVCLDCVALLVMAEDPRLPAQRAEALARRRVRRELDLRRAVGASTVFSSWRIR